jgi:hypothetical protein
MKINKLTKMLGATLFLVTPLAMIPTITACSSTDNQK